MSRNGRAGRWRRALAVITVIGAVLAGISLQVAGAGPAGAAINDYTTATYNMQGSAGGVGGGSKWTSDVQSLLRSGVQVLALQEAGAPPGGARMHPPQTVIVHTSGGGEQHFTFEQGTWRPGGSRGPVYYIYWLQTDPRGNRVNLAMVTTQRAAAFRTAYGGAGGRGRPALGVRFGNDIFWTVHALARGGTNSAALVQNIADASAPRNWAAMGDWNLSPQTLARNDFHEPVFYYRTGQPTQQSQNELDYMVSSENVPGYGAELVRSMGSDHHPVRFMRLRAGAEAPLGLFNAGSGDFLGLESNTPRPGTWLFLRQSQQQYGGSWYLDPAGTGSFRIPVYRIRNTTTNECLYLPNTTSLATEQPCSASAGQRFTVTSDSRDATHLMFRSNLPGDLCVGASARSDQVGFVDLRTCRNPGTFWNWHYDDDHDPSPNAPLVVFGL